MSFNPMKKTQLSLDNDIYKQLKKLSILRGVTMPELIKTFINDTEEVEFQEIEGIEDDTSNNVL